jgi:hypothetical protein
MKRKLQQGFIPKWRRQMETKHWNVVKDRSIKVLVEAPAWVQPYPLGDPSKTNHERVKATRAYREKKKALLRELVKKTKETHPNETRSYREWTLLAVKETQEKLHEQTA